jgi:hypothetical protein
MTSIITMLHSLHHYTYLPLILFLLALIVVVASYSGKEQKSRLLGYLLAACMLFAIVYII